MMLVVVMQVRPCMFRNVMFVEVCPCMCCDNICLCLCCLALGVHMSRSWPLVVNMVFTCEAWCVWLEFRSVDVCCRWSNYVKPLFVDLSKPTPGAQTSSMLGETGCPLVPCFQALPGHQKLVSWLTSSVHLFKFLVTYTSLQALLLGKWYESC